MHYQPEGLDSNYKIRLPAHSFGKEALLPSSVYHATHITQWTRLLPPFVPTASKDSENEAISVL